VSAADRSLPVTAHEPGLSLADPDLGPSHEAAIARDMVLKGLAVAPVVAAVAWLIADGNVAVSIAYGMAVVMVNFLLSAYLLAGAARISLGLIASVALGGYAMRLALVFAAVWLIRDTSWVRFVPLGISMIATHLGLLVWELRHVSATVTHPGLKPRKGRAAGRGTSVPAAGYRPDRYRNRLNQP
jgi:hypothetical protein